MENLINFYNKNKGTKPLFSTYDIIDWYDGAICGIGKLNKTNNFYLFNIVAWDLVSDMKIFSIVNVTLPWLNKFKDAINKSESNNILQLSEDYIQQYSGEIFLLKSKKIESSEYDLIKYNSKSLEVYNNLDEIVNQSEKEKQNWFNLFTPPLMLH